MAITLDPTTQAAYLVATTLSARASAVVAAFSGTVTVKVFDGTDTERASGTFSGAWASQTAGTITAGEVASLTVSDGGTPDDDWYVLFEDADSWLRGTFGLAGSGKNFTWSGATFETGQVGDLGTITFTAIDPSPTSVPANTVLPVISGTAQVGELLSATSGTWSGTPTPTYAYQWLRNSANISGATSSGYALVEADEAASIAVRVTATNSAGSANATSAAVGPVAAADVALAISTVPTITIDQGGTHPLAQYVTGGTEPYTYDLASGTLPSGVTLNTATGLLTATASATLGTQTGLSFGVTDSATVASLPTFGITSAVGGTDLPFTFGHVFSQEDVPSGSYVDSDLTDWQVVPTTTWPDGSLRHAIISGRATLTAGVQKNIVLSVGAARTGTALTEANLSAALPTTTLAITGYTTITLGSLVGTAALHRTVCSGPIMSSWIYRSALSTTLVAWFDVRLYKGGRVEVFPWIENGYLTGTAPTTTTLALTFTMGGTTRFNQSVAIAHRTRIPLLDATHTTFSHWSSDPQITPTHDVDYLRASKMVPNYIDVTPSDVTLDGLQQTYTPNTLAGVPSNMGDAGGSGALLGWSTKPAQSLYCVSGDARAYRAAIVFGLSAGSWSIHYRDSVTNEPFTFADYPSVTNQGTSTPSVPAGAGAVNGSFAQTHQPGFAYLPWLLTGRWWFLDEQLFIAGRNYFVARIRTRRGETSYESSPFLYADGSAGIIDPTTGVYSPRGAAWALAALAHATASVPSGHAAEASLKAAVAANADFYRQTFVDGTFSPGWVSPLGVLGDYSSANTSLYSGSSIATGSTAWWGAGWMYAMIQQAWGRMRELDLDVTAQAASDIESVCSHGLKLATGLAGDGVGDWNYRRFQIYAFPVATNGAASLRTSDTWFSTFAAALTEYESGGLGSIDATEGLSIKAHMSNTDVTGTTFTYGSMQLAALSYAVDVGVTGASAGYARVTGSSSYASILTAFASDPSYAIVPRSA